MRVATYTHLSYLYCSIYTGHLLYYHNITFVAFTLLHLLHYKFYTASLSASSSLSFLVSSSLPAFKNWSCSFLSHKTQEFWSLAIQAEYHHSSFTHTSPRLSAHICGTKFFITHLHSRLCTSVTQASEDPHTLSRVSIPLSHTLLLHSVSLSVLHLCPARVLVLFGVWFWDQLLLAYQQPIQLQWELLKAVRGAIFWTYMSKNFAVSARYGRIYTVQSFCSPLTGYLWGFLARTKLKNKLKRV